MSTYEIARPAAPRPTGVYLTRTELGRAGKPITNYHEARLIFAGTDGDGIHWWRILGEVRPDDDLHLGHALPAMTVISGFHTSAQVLAHHKGVPA